jgi:CRP-like cAMP-binding protein
MQPAPKTLPSQSLTLDPNHPLTSSLLRKMMRRDDVSDEEQEVLIQLVLDPVSVEAGHDIVREGDRPTASTLLVEGFAVRYKILEAGGRQITALHGPGDFVDLHSYLLKQMDHGILALTRCRTARAPHAALRRISETHAHLSRLLSLLMLIDGSIHREWLVAMGRRDALGNAAHLICETYIQLEMVGLAPQGEFLFPVTQTDLADMLGVSAVHANRTLQSLRAMKVIEWRGERVRILDWAALADAAEFDSRYLHLTREPR